MMLAPTVSRLMLPDDANPFGNVHGGTILQIMEEAGMIHATRHCNSDPDQEHCGNLMAGLVRIESMSFLKPAHVGNVLSAATEIVFTSPKSILVKVTVTCEDLTKVNSKKVTNTGLLWYASFVLPYGQVRAEVPQVARPSDEEGAVKQGEYDGAKKMYEERKQLNVEGGDEEPTPDECFGAGKCLCTNCRSKFEVPEGANKIKNTKQRLCQMVLPGDCGTGKVAFGGFIMKIMDNAAACSAVVHARSNIVTVSISSLDFKDYVLLGDLVTIDAEITYVSAKTMDVTVSATVSSLKRGTFEVAKGMYTFVALGKDLKPIPVPALVYETEEEFERAYECQKIAEKGKRMRASKK